MHILVSKSKGNSLKKLTLTKSDRPLRKMTSEVSNCFDSVVVLLPKQLTMALVTPMSCVQFLGKAWFYEIIRYFECINAIQVALDKSAKCKNLKEYMTTFSVYTFQGNQPMT